MLAMVLGKIGRYREFIGIYRVSEGRPLHIPVSGKYPEGFEIQFYDPPQDRPWIAVVIGFVSYHDDTIADLVDVWFLESPESPGTDEVLKETLADYRGEPRLLDYMKMGVYVYSREPRRWKISYYDYNPEPDWNRDPEVDDRPVDPAEYAYEFQVS